jgi:hypothetical protein
VPDGTVTEDAKNHSLLTELQVRLAPLYDLASALPYDNLYLPKLKMAMRIGGEYTAGRIGRRHWQSLATSVGVDPDRLYQRVTASPNAHPKRSPRRPTPNRSRRSTAIYPAVWSMGSPLMRRHAAPRRLGHSGRMA